MTPGTRIRKLSAALAAAESVSDGELLRRYARNRDSAAFELLVRRHSELVWAVCRGRHPRDHHAAEDAFQACFLVLARKSDSIRDPSAAGWLFRVARRCAERIPTRRETSELLDSIPAGAVANRFETNAIVHEEVESLEKPLREAVLLCFFEGYTHAQAAERLGWPLGTLASRLARAKDRLKTRFQIRGLGAPILALGVTGLSSTVLEAAIRGEVSQSVRILTTEVLAMMGTAKLKIAVAATAVVLAIGLGFGLAQTTKPGTKGDDPKPMAKAPEPNEDLKKLQGEWKIVKYEKKGEVPKEDAAVLKGTTIRIHGDHFDFEILAPDRQLDRFYRQSSTFTIDAGAKPKRIDLVFPNAESDKFRTNKGIYEFEGGRLRLCIDFDSSTDSHHRPEKFELKEPYDIIMVLERTPESTNVTKQTLAKRDAAKEVLDLIEARVRTGQLQGSSHFETYMKYSRLLAEAEVELAVKPEDRIKAFETHLATAKAKLEFNKKRVEQGVEEPQLLPISKYEVAEAELLLERAKARK